MFNFKMASQSRKMPQILKNKSNVVALGNIWSHYLIIGSEHNGDVLPKNYKHTRHD